MHLHLSTWKEIESYLLQSQGILITIGSTEQHGPNGLIGTDAIYTTAIASHAVLKVDLLVGPTLALGPAQFNLKFPGTISLRPPTMMRLVEDYVLSLSSQGFQRFYFLNGHGGNLAPVHATFQEIYTLHSLRVHESLAPRCRLRSWWEYPGMPSGSHCMQREKAHTPRTTRWQWCNTLSRNTSRMLVWGLGIPSPWNICATTQAMITSTFQIITAAIQTVGSAPTPALPIPKTVNACWKPLLLNCLKTIWRSLKKSDIREDRTVALTPDNSGLQNFGKSCFPNYCLSHFASS